MRCDGLTYTWDEPGPAAGGAAANDLAQIPLHPGTHLSLFCIEFWQTVGGDLFPVATANVSLELADRGIRDRDRALRVIDRTTVSVEGQVQGRLLVAFPQPLRVPEGESGNTMNVMLRVNGIAAGCERWTAWLNVLRMGVQ